MLTTSYPLYPGDTTAPFIEELAAHIADLGHEVALALPAHPRLRRGPKERGVRLYPFRYAPGIRRLQVWGYASSMSGDVGLKGAAYAAAPLALVASTLATARLVRRLRPDLVVAHWVIPNGPPAALIARLDGPTAGGQPARLGCLPGRTQGDHRAAVRGRSSAPPPPSPPVVPTSPPAPPGSAPIPRRRRRSPTASIRPASAPPQRTSARRVRRDLGLRDDERLILTGGRLVHKKGIDVAIDAFATAAVREAGTARLVIFGYGDLQDELMAQVARLGLTERVIFAGRIERDRLSALFAAADLFLLPSVHDHAGNVDGLPNTLLEAMATGLPIIASNVVGVPTVIDDGIEGLLVPERDVTALSAAIATLLRDPARAATLGTAARSRVERELTWPQIAQRYLAVYREALARHRAGSTGGR